ncbi:MAG: SpoIIE family protein phosphatase [Bauldia sp.]|nr:SpoIIE family protein phosphatase [Bauldia sp.]MCW5719240.1 SpoIIE family protein phosphatase [Bauldia sp.]
MEPCERIARAPRGYARGSGPPTPDSVVARWQDSRHRGVGYADRALRPVPSRTSPSFFPLERLLIYSDGLVDAAGPVGESFGEERLLEWLGNRGAELAEVALEDLARPLKS